MPRLKDRSLDLPGSHHVLHPDGGMSKPFKGTFAECVEFERNFRQKNPVLCRKHGWTLDPFEIEEWVEQQQVARCVAHGWTSYLEGNPVSPPNWPRQPSLSRDALADVAEAAPRTPVSIKLVMDWLGEDLIPAHVTRAENRAMICTACPLHQPGALTDDERIILALKTEMGLRTSRDIHLKHCMACQKSCALLVWSKERPMGVGLVPFDDSCWLQQLNDGH